MEKDFFYEIFDEIEKSLGNIKFNGIQSINSNGINVKKIKHKLKEYTCNENGEEVSLLYCIIKKKDNTVDFLEIPKNMGREIKLVLSEDGSLIWKILGLNQTSEDYKESYKEDNKIIILTPELDFESNTVYQFSLQNYLNIDFRLYNINPFDTNYKKKNFWNENYYNLIRFFSKDFNEFLKLQSSLSKNKYYIVSSVDSKTWISILENKLKTAKNREEHFLNSRLMEFCENAERWFSIIDLFSGWYFKAKSKISLSDYKEPIQYINYLSVRNDSIEFKKQKNINLKFLRKVSSKLLFKKDVEDTELDLFERNNIIFNTLNLVFTSQGGIGE
jgi:hypothetical protein